MTTQRALALLVLWFVAVLVASVIYLSVNQQPPLAVEEVPMAPACGAKANPCAKIDCNRIDTRKLT